MGNHWGFACHFRGYILRMAVEPSLLHTVQYEIMTSRTKPVKIAFFTDTHFGEQYSPDHLARIVEEINAQKVEAVLFGGDFF